MRRNPERRRTGSRRSNGAAEGQSADLPPGFLGSSCRRTQNEEYPYFVAAMVVLAVALVFMGVKTVPQGFEYTVERFGRYTRTLPPGLHLIAPLVERPTPERDGTGNGYAIAGNHHARQRHGHRRRRGVLSGARPRQGVLRGAAARNPQPHDDHHPDRDGDLDELLSQRDKADLLRVVDEATAA